MKKLIAFFEIPAADLERAVNFYEEVFNLKLTVMDCETEKMAFFPEEEGICPGAISFAADFKPSKDGVLISLNVENMETAFSSIAENGGKTILPKTRIEAEERGYFSIFTDSEGNRIGLYSDR